MGLFRVQNNNSEQVSMPVEGSASLAPSVVARQIGGRTLESQSGYWQILFPAPITRIDGRVPVDKSSQYLVATRLNPQKELIAVCFTPAQDDDAAKFNELIEFFVEKKSVYTLSSYVYTTRLLFIPP